MSILRVRFKTKESDYRPVLWPIPYPYWCTGHTDDASIIVAYADSEEYVYKYWPEAEELDAEERDEITFTDRFAKPDWYEDK